MIPYGNRVFGLAGIALGLLGLASGDFAGIWQPVPEGVPGRAALAYAAAVAQLAAGVALQWRRTAGAGALVLAALSAVFAFFWAQRVIGFPAIFGTWLGFAEQLALVIGGVVAYANLQPRDRAARLALGGRLVFGLCLVVFGVAHFVYPAETAAFVPAWIPPDQRAWAFATGAAHALAGLALLSGIRAVLAARLLTAMFVGFALLVWAPRLFASPDHMAWAGNAINFALVGAAWAVADSIARFASRES